MEYTNLKISNIKSILEKYNYSKQKLISILHDIQNNSGENYISEENACYVAKELNMPISKVYDVMTFHSMFECTPKGKYIIEVCNNAPCRVRNARQITSVLERVLNIKVGETTSDNLFTLKYTSCIGACDISPAMKIGHDIYGNLTEDKIKNIIESYKEGNYEKNN
ncbi:NAD(P)H-dependent oxidoreductase subunit E [Clostridium oceanicum]|uniref:NADH-quinone oxidoreductase subunit NuoE n=1 Tax=Clostridium oceanicum TaxID=1543 RepID=A0ABP3UZ21_9CLOT